MEPLLIFYIFLAYALGFLCEYLRNRKNFKNNCFSKEEIFVLKKIAHIVANDSDLKTKWVNEDLPPPGIIQGNQIIPNESKFVPVNFRKKKREDTDPRFALKPTSPSMRTRR